MKYSIWSGKSDTVTTDCLVLAVTETGALPPETQKIDKACQGLITRLRKQGDFKGSLGQTLLLHHLPTLKAKRLLLAGCGKSASPSLAQFRKMTTACVQTLIASGAKDAHFTLTTLTIAHYDEAALIQQTICLVQDGLYQFEHYRSEKKPAPLLTAVHFSLSHKNLLAKANQAIQQGVAISAGTHFTRDLANHPSNVCTPTWLGEQAKKLAHSFKTLSTRVLTKAELKKQGLGALLAVGQGSAQEPRLICIEYRGTSRKQAPVVLVGKGITFDTGGISLKPADSMPGMKYDMCGAATVLGTLKAAAQLKLPLHLVGIIASAENMPSGHAYKPEDIITSLSGQTIEVLNTDAEGRLVLCDALTYAERYNPDVVIDIATLTGAVVIALGHHATGLMSNNQSLADALLKAGQKCHDRAWQLPLWDDYQEQLKSPYADMANVGGRSAGSITAACFLSRFAKKFHWAHLDVAGTAAMMMGGSERFATGRPVPLLMQYLIDRSPPHAKG